MNNNCDIFMMPFKLFVFLSYIVLLQLFNIACTFELPLFDTNSRYVGIVVLLRYRIKCY